MLRVDVTFLNFIFSELLISALRWTLPPSLSVTFRDVEVAVFVVAVSSIATAVRSLAVELTQTSASVATLEPRSLLLLRKYRATLVVGGNDDDGDNDLKYIFHVFSKYRCNCMNVDAFTSSKPSSKSSTTSKWQRYNHFH